MTEIKAPQPIHRHTQGPWLCKYGAGQTVHPGTTVAEVGPTSTDVGRWWIFSDADEHGDSEADARLIAAAPELLQALQALCADGLHTQAQWDAARDAIAKATGAQA